MNGLPLFEHVLIRDAREKRDSALRQIEENAAADTLEVWWQAFRDFCRRRPEVFTDDFVNDALYVRKLPALREPRAIGVLFKRGLLEDLIEATERFHPSVRSNCSPKRVWRSLVFEGARS